MTPEPIEGQFVAHPDCCAADTCYGDPMLGLVLITREDAGMLLEDVLLSRTGAATGKSSICRARQQP